MDTISWFPHHLKIPTPSAIDRIAAGVHNIASALTHSTSGSPLSPLDTSLVAALNDLLRLLTATLPDTNEVHPIVDPSDTTTPSPIDVVSPDAPHLRVEHEPQGDKDDRVTYRTASKRKSRK